MVKLNDTEKVRLLTWFDYYSSEMRRENTSIKDADRILFEKIRTDMNVCKNCNYFKPCIFENMEGEGRCQKPVGVIVDDNYSCGSWVEKE